MALERITLHCQFCQRRIGIIRRFRDKEYCSDEHRRQMRARSSRALRDVGYEMYKVEENWDERHFGETPIRRLDQEKPKQANLPGTALVLAFVAGVAFFAFLGRDGSASVDPGPSASRRDGMFQTLVDKLPSGTPTISITENFSTGWNHWQGGSGSASGWSFDSGLIRPGDLKLWKQSSSLANYRLQFEGKIDRRGMSWAFRAPNVDNYYATKINLGGKGKNSTSAEIVRYMVQNGKPGVRETFPLPLLVRPSEFFRVDVKVKNNRFTTSIDGHVVDVWTDDRIRNGGVGFFNEKGELSALKWVALSEADTFVEKMKSFLYLSYIIPPPMM